ncbi:hydroxymethylbilane synthase [Myxococcota bacterium]|nr:hydroxymethylbilane synthase [Myxococcota bacterium]
MRPLRIGSRGSPLALRQTGMVAEALGRGGREVAVEVIHTRGDRILDVPLSRVGGKGLFVKEIEEALLDGRCDLAVHSLKDVPAELPPGLVLGACLVREVPFDALVSRWGPSLRDLPDGGRVGTSSLRRQAQLLAARPDLRVGSLRGNVETRLRRFEEGLDAVILAAAGLRRLGMGDRISGLLEPPEFVPAAGQGIVVVECRESDREVREILWECLEDPATRVVMRAERAFLAAMEGGCQVPLGAWCRAVDGGLAMTGFLARPDGTDLRRVERAGDAGTPEALGREVAEALLASGGREILASLVEPA